MTTIINYVIKRLETLQFAMFPDRFVNGKDVEIRSGFGFDVKNDYSTIRHIVDFEFYQDEELILTLKIACYFELAPETQKEIEKEQVIPVDFLRYMGTISVGLARGVIHAKTEGTVLNSVVLPPINLVDAIKEDLILKS